MSHFSRVSSSVWNLQRSSYSQYSSFEQIVGRVAATCAVHRIRRERKRCEDSFARIVVTFTADQRLIDAFHNSPVGYRAQYYSSVQDGDRANRYVVEHLSPLVLAFLAATPIRGYSLSWADTSLAGPHSKAWIHQGRWLRAKRRSDRVLFPPRWKAKSLGTLADHDAKLLIWGSLAPQDETRLCLKGTCVLPDGTVSKRVSKPTRGLDLHEFGFT
jgi:hypothetical protein